MSHNHLSEPAIILPAEHGITLDMIDSDALFVLRKLSKAGFSSYLVGGGVRDLYLGKPPKDFDIGTDARPGQVRRLFSNSRTIGRRFRLVQVFFRNGKIIEVSTLRSLSEHDLDGPEAVLASNNTYGSPGEDAQRRDLTINALFFEIETQTIIDHVNGFADLKQGVIRMIGEPNKRINRDPVRMLRAIRHAARNHFTIEERTWLALSANSHKLVLCPAARLRDELLKDIYSGSSAEWFELSCKTGIFYQLFPLYKNRAAFTGVPPESLQPYFRTIDRLNARMKSGGKQPLPDHLLLSLILLPWANEHFQVLKPSQQSSNRDQVSADLRDTIDATIGSSLGLTRSCRQEISTMLAHLPIMSAYHKQNNWPKWLKRKSYFKKCRLLYFCSLEATEQAPVPDHLLLATADSAPRPSSPTPSKRNPHRKSKPAISATHPGGIFGFKR